jgi:hypothetical protein
MNRLCDSKRSIELGRDPAGLCHQGLQSQAGIRRPARGSVDDLAKDIGPDEFAPRVNELPIDDPCRTVADPVCCAESNQKWFDLRRSPKRVSPSVVAPGANPR